MSTSQTVNINIIRDVKQKDQNVNRINMQPNNRDVSLINDYHDVIQQLLYDSHAKFCIQFLDF